MPPDRYVERFLPCAGSGTTLVAARALNRHGIGSDLHEEYCEVMRERIQK